MKHKAHVLYIVYRKHTGMRTQMTTKLVLSDGDSAPIAASIEIEYDIGFV